MKSNRRGKGLLGWPLPLAGLAVVLLSPPGGRAAELTLEGLLVPNRTVRLSAVEPGVLEALHLKIGDWVEAGAIVAELDRETFELQWEAARQRAAAQGELAHARAEVELHASRYRQLERLHREGHARTAEWEQGRAELEMAKARLLSAEEAAVERKLVERRAKLQLDRRTIRAPTRGLISVVHAEEGEYLVPLHPEVVTLIEVDPMLATFDLPSERATEYRAEQQVRVIVRGESYQGQLRSISPAIDAASGTVRLTVELPNPDLQLKSGEPCVFPAQRSTTTPLAVRPATSS